MSLHDYVIDNANGAAVRLDLNNAFAAIQSQNSNATSPVSTTPFMFWFDTTANELKVRNSGDTTWVSIFDLAGTILTPFFKGSLMGDACVRIIGTVALGNVPDIEDIQNQQGIYVANDTGAADVYVIAPVPPIGGYAEGQLFGFKVAVTNTGTSTLNVSSKGPITIKKNPGQLNLDAGDFVAGDIVFCTYDGTFFQLVGTFRVIATQGEAETGTNNFKAMTPLRTKQAKDFNQFESAEQTVTASTILTIPHSLSAIPTRVRVVLRCKIAQHGYSVGDEINIFAVNSSPGLGHPAVAETADATNILLVQGVGFIIISQATLIDVSITTANWKWVIYANL